MTTLKFVLGLACFFIGFPAVVTLVLCLMFAGSGPDRGPQTWATIAFIPLALLGVPLVPVFMLGCKLLELDGADLL